jgi:DNA-directed RNA polymerase subunit E'/Rpb7
MSLQLKRKQYTTASASSSSAAADNIYTRVLINKKVVLKIVNIGTNIKQVLEKAIAIQIEGKCIIEGYVKSGSIAVITFSSGVISAADIVFEVVFECLVCSPVEGMILRCIAKNITKAGIRAETSEDPSPVVIFIARDHHYKSDYFSTVKENDTIQVKVIGQRYELNDKYVSVIAELLAMPLPIIAPLIAPISTATIQQPPLTSSSLTTTTTTAAARRTPRNTNAPRKKLTILEE